MRLLALDIKITKAAQKPFCYAEETGMLLLDNRLTRVIELYKRSAVERFIENYLKAIRQFLLLKVKEEQLRNASASGSGIVVNTARPDIQWALLDWKCSCGELEKTGVACPHLIRLACETPNKPYIELINSKLCNDVLV